jgi:hypothetical protein
VHNSPQRLCTRWAIHTSANMACLLALSSCVRFVTETLHIYPAGGTRLNHHDSAVSPPRHQHSHRHVGHGGSLPDLTSRTSLAHCVLVMACCSQQRSPITVLATLCHIHSPLQPPTNEANRPPHIVDQRHAQKQTSLRVEADVHIIYAHFT